VTSFSQSSNHRQSRDKTSLAERLFRDISLDYKSILLAVALHGWMNRRFGNLLLKYDKISRLRPISLTQLNQHSSRVLFAHYHK